MTTGVEAKVGRSSGLVERIGDQRSHFHHVARDGSATMPTSTSATKQRH
ncbi:MAG: hypothetical protein WKF82_10340 [Nocardioidaceae bacterium]